MNLKYYKRYEKKKCKLCGNEFEDLKKSIKVFCEDCRKSKKRIEYYRRVYSQKFKQEFENLNSIQIKNVHLQKLVFRPLEFKVNKQNSYDLIYKQLKKMERLIKKDLEYLKYIEK